MALNFVNEYEIERRRVYEPFAAALFLQQRVLNLRTVVALDENTAVP